MSKISQDVLKSKMCRTGHAQTGGGVRGWLGRKCRVLAGQQRHADRVGAIVGSGQRGRIRVAL